MTNKQKGIIARTAKYAETILGKEATGHDWLHVKRVWLNAKMIGKGTKADMFIVELAALLHDIADWKFHGGDTSVGSRKVEVWLKKMKLGQKSIGHITSIIEKASFKGSGVKNQIDTLEGKIVQDADRLDAIGAIGIARTFAYGGAKGREIYNPKIKPSRHDSADAYSKNTSPTINHFYEKLLLLKELMNTKTGKSVAHSRHKFMLDFLKQFAAEVTGHK